MTNDDDEAATPQAFGIVELIPWLRTRIAEAQGVATSAAASDYLSMEDGSDAMEEFLRTFTPEAAVGQCEAHTAILDLHVPVNLVYNDYGAYEPSVPNCRVCVGRTIGEDPDGRSVDGTMYAPWPCATVKAVALAYQHRPGYQESWRP